MTRRLVFVLSFFAICYLLFTVYYAFAQSPTPNPVYDTVGTGRDGDLNVAGIQTVNTAKAALAQTASAGQKVLVVSSLNGLARRDEVLIVQTQGTNAGAWETAYVVDTRPKSLLLNRRLSNTFTVDSSSKAQVVKIPHYQNVNVNGTLTAPAWDGSSGGILAMRVRGTLNVASGGKIDVSEKGFRGGNPGKRNQCGQEKGIFYCGAGTSCFARSCDGSTCFTCDADPAGSSGYARLSEGPLGTGGKDGSDGMKGWNGGTLQTGEGGSNQTRYGDGGGGAGGGGAGGGGALLSQATAGERGSDGTRGQSVASNVCSTVSSNPKRTTATNIDGEQEIQLEYKSNTESCTNIHRQWEASSQDWISCTQYTSCGRSGTRSSSYSNGPPRGRKGGTGGFAATLVSSSSNRLLMGAGGGYGGFGGQGGSGGSFGGAGGAPGAGGSGGNGSGAVLIIAKTASVEGQIVSNGGIGGNGSQGQRGGNGEFSERDLGGAGGGGAGGAGGAGGSGGTILLFRDAFSGSGTITAQGGTGGSGNSGGRTGTGYREGGNGGSGGSGGSGSLGIVTSATSASLNVSSKP